MKNSEKSKEQLFEELEQIERRVAVLEATEKSLRESERRLQSLLTSLPLGVAECDVDGVITLANPAYHKMLGYAEGELVGMQFVDLMAPSPQKAALPAYLKYLATDQPAPTPYRCEDITKDGRVIALQIDWNYQRNQHGKAIGFVSIISDITERKRTEEDLTKNQAMLQATIDNLPFDFFAIDLDGRYILQNAMSKARWGCVIGQRPEEICPSKEELALWLENNRRAFSGERIDEDVTLLSNGEQRFFNNILTPIHHEATLYGILGMNIDITARKQAENALQENQRRLTTLLSNLPGMAYRCKIDPNWTMEFISDGCLLLTGYTPMALMGNHEIAYGDIIHPEDRERVWQEVQPAILAGKHFQVEYRILTASGEEKWVWEQGIGIYDDSGEAMALEGLMTDITARKQAEEALRSSETKYRRLHQSMMDAFVIVDLDGLILEFNDAYCQMTGYQPEEIVKLRYRDITPEKWHSFEAEIVETQVLKRGYSEIYEKEYRRKDGTIFPVELRAFLIEDDHSPSRTMWAIVRDISQRKRAEESLRKAHDELEERVKERTAELLKANESLDIFRKFAEASGDGFGMSEFDGRIVYVNPTLCQMFGEQKPEDIIGTSVFSYYSEEYVQRRKNEMIPALLNEGFWHSEQTVVPRHGKQVHTLQNTFLIQDENGNPFRIAVVISDITDRKRAEEALHESEEKYRMLVEACPDAVVMSDSEMRIIFASQRAVELYGATNDAEICGQNLTDFVAEEERSQAIAKASELFISGVRRRSEYTFLRKNGTRFPCEVSTGVVKRDSGRLMGVIAIVRDITERRLAEEALQREHRTLKHLLQSSDHERQTIAYEIHDGLAQYLAGAIMQFDVYKHQLEKKPNDAWKAYEAAMTMLQQSHFETRRLIAGVRPPVLDEAGAVEAIAHLINEQNREKGPKVEFHSIVVFHRLVPLLENAIYRIIQEGMTNACKHSQSSRVRITLLQQRERIRIEIRDWGIGFKPSDATEGCYGLTGIRERARLLGGKCRIQSATGKGTRITVELPLVEREE